MGFQGIFVAFKAFIKIGERDPGSQKSGHLVVFTAQVIGGGVSSGQIVDHHGIDFGRTEFVVDQDHWLAAKGQGQEIGVMHLSGKDDYTDTVQIVELRKFIG